MGTGAKGKDGTRQNGTEWLNKLGATPILGSNQLLSHDIEYRINAVDISTVICTGTGSVAKEVDMCIEDCPGLRHRIIVDGERDGWRSFDREFRLFSERCV